MANLTNRERRGCTVSKFIDSVQNAALGIFLTMKQSVSDPNLTTKTTPNPKLIVRIRKKRSPNNNMQQQQQQHEQETYDMMFSNSNSNSNSPYYKGLTDQSLAILDDAASSSPSPPPYSPFYSPYYKGLTDYTLAIPSPNSPTHHNNIIHPLPSNTHESSPYYRGLIDYSLALHGSTHSSSSPNTFFHADASFLIEHHDPNLMEKVESAATIQVGNETVLELVPEKDLSFEIREQKPLRESSVLEEKAIPEEIMMADLITDDDDDDDVIEEEKPLRERVSEAAQEIEDRKPYYKGLTDLSLAIRKKDTSLSSVEASHGNGEYQYTWTTKHQPVSLEDFICNRDKALQLKALIKEGCGCSHFIFEGPSNAGKRSMIRAMLREVFGAHRVQVTEELKEFNIKVVFLPSLVSGIVYHSVCVCVSFFSQTEFIETSRKRYENNLLI